jgi:hypothetical protein
MPPDVNVRDLGTAPALVEGAGAKNGGLAIDTWHLAKLGIPSAELARIPRRTSPGSSCPTASGRTWPTRSTR